MVESLQNLQAVYAKWQSRNPYLRGNDASIRLPGYQPRGGGDSRMNGPVSWQTNSGSGLRPPARRRAGKERGRSRRENGLTDADELMVCSYYSLYLYVLWTG